MGMMFTPPRGSSQNNQVHVIYLREFPTPVILDQARERAALRCKNETTFRALKVAQVWHGLTGRFARNGGHGSIEESEILNMG